MQKGQPSSPKPSTEKGLFVDYIKPALIFIIITILVGARLPETLAEETGENLNLLVATLYAIVGVLLTTTRLHFLVSSFILYLLVIFNLPHGQTMTIITSLEGLLLLPLIAVSMWMALHISRILNFAMLLLGLGLLLPSDVPPPMHMDSSYLFASMIALLITPLIHILTTKRDRGL
ncbi:MAG: hypothetical protein G8345_00155 [Magnetococcales bacterium]|nr:hypothetical protein [Magnetococcales bacterium]NGZ25278.1 hypothetical protein [Magnetococcales bacterium]